MTAVKIADKRIVIGERQLPLLSGEVHYWRLDPANWRSILQRVREMGLEIIATYVCWDYHELQPGVYDFHGETDPRRNLTGFLDLVTDEDFWIIIRPGPYIYSEWRNNGVPDYAARYHRLDPAFQRAAQPYMEAVVDAIGPYLATRGGRVILLQADNEIDPWPHWYVEELGLGSKPGPFQSFLRQRYESMNALNEAWNTRYEEFDDVRATRVMLPDQPDLMRRYLDFTHFRHWYVNEVARWAVRAYQDLGVDVPICLNTYSGVETQRWADLEEIADVVGPDIYPSNEFEHRTNEHRNFLDAVRYTRTYSRLPYIPEFEVGIWDDWLPDVKTLTPEHYRLMCLSALLAGVAGWNWYMLVNRDNWYLCPINEWGRIRPHLFATFQQIVSLFKSLDPPGLTKLTNTALTYDPLHRSTTRPGQRLLQACYDAGIDYEFYDTERGQIRKPVLFYAGDHWLSAAAQESLLQYVEDGGHLICAGAFPRHDAEFRPLNRLQIPMPDGIVNNPAHKQSLELSLREMSAKLSSSWMHNYRDVPGEPIIVKQLSAPNLTAEELALQANLSVGTTYTVGFTQRRGQGQLTVVGLEPSPALLLSLHQFARVPILVRSATPGVLASLFKRDDTFYLIVVNNGNEAKTATLMLDRMAMPQGCYRAEDLFNGREVTVNLQHDNRLTVPLARKDGSVLRLVLI